MSIRIVHLARRAPPSKTDFVLSYSLPAALSGTQSALSHLLLPSPILNIFRLNLPSCSLSFAPVKLAHQSRRLSSKTCNICDGRSPLGRPLLVGTCLRDCSVTECEYHATVTNFEVTTSIAQSAPLLTVSHLPHTHVLLLIHLRS